MRKWDLSSFYVQLAPHEQAIWPIGCTTCCGMQGSHQTPISEDVTDPREAWLTQAFSDFVGASARLESSYRELGSKVAELTLNITQKEHALLSSRSEIDSISSLLHGILQALPCGVLVRNGKGEVDFMNSVAARLLALLAAGLPDFSSTDLAMGPSALPSSSAAPGASERDFAFATSAGRHLIRVRSAHLRPEAAEKGASVVTIMEDLTEHTRSRPQGSLHSGSQGPAGLSMEEVERRHLRHTLEQVGGNRTRAAQILRISVRTLSSKIKQYDLPPRRCA